MFCESCGSKVEDGVKFCPECGAPLYNNAEVHQDHSQMEGNFSNQNAAPFTQPDQGQQSWSQSDTSYGQTGNGYNTGSAYGGAGFTEVPMSFSEAVRTVLQDKYAVFNGRARRAEYWYFVVFNILLNTVSQFIFGSFSPDRPLSYVSALISLAILVPGLAVAVRRLHDIGKSGLFLLLIFVPLIGAIILLVFMAKDSEPGQNQYGPNPKYQTPLY